jgi:hypothetical protein
MSMKGSPAFFPIKNFFKLYAEQKEGNPTTFKCTVTQANNFNSEETKIFRALKPSFLSFEEALSMDVVGETEFYSKKYIYKNENGAKFVTTRGDLSGINTIE